MPPDDLAHLELLAEVDTLVARLDRWAQDAPSWQTAENCRALIQRLSRRANTLRVRLDAPLVVATLGGTGTGKSTLVNALLGADVVTTGRQRPTTTSPTLICRPDLTPEILGIETLAEADGTVKADGTVEVVHRDLPALADLVLIDCPDPDTTEVDETSTESATTEDTKDLAAHGSNSNLARLRAILPHCDVLLVTATQQKYRNARVAHELAAAAPGARIVFVQTHADLDDDIRDDWCRVLDPHYTTGHVFRVDSVAALNDAKQGLRPRGEFAQLVDLLTRQLAGAAGNRIRRANFLDLVEEALERCRTRIDAAMPAVENVRQAIDEQRTRLAAQLGQQMRAELLNSRRLWENRLLGQAASRWGFSPFALVLRSYQGLGGLLSSTLLLRARTPAQMALWGTLQGARALHSWQRTRQADRELDRAAGACWDETELRAAALVLEGYANEAGLSREAIGPGQVAEEATTAAGGFVEDTAGQLQSLIERLAGRHTGWFTRWRYELLLLAMLGFLLYRLGKNFFYDSWLAADPVTVYGLDFYVSAAFWMLLWCGLLLWMFTGRLRRGLRQQIDQLAQSWGESTSAAGLFARLENDCLTIEDYRRQLDVLQHEVAQLRRHLALPDAQLGHRK